MTAKDPAARPTPRMLLQWTRDPALIHSGADADTVAGASATVVLRPDPAQGLDATVVDRPTAAPAAAQSAAPTTAAAGPAAAPVHGPAEPKPRKRGRPLLLALVLLAALGLGVWWISGMDGGLRGPDQASPPASTGPTPAAPPAGTSASSGDWSMSSWSIQNNPDGTMSVQGTVTNNGTATASGTATAFIYSDGQPIGTASGQLPDVPAGGSVDVTLVGTDQWQPGAKSIALEVA